MSTDARREPTPFHMENLKRLVAELRLRLDAREFEVMNMERLDLDALSELQAKQVKDSQLFEWCNNLGVKYFPQAGPRIQPIGPMNGMRSIN